MDEPTVSVRGEAVLEVDPEIVTVHVGVTARDRDRDKALQSLQQRLAAVDAVLARYGDAVEQTHTDSVRVYPQFKDGRAREKVIGYVANARHAITLKELGRVGDVVADLASQELSDVAGPWWALRPDSDVYRQARLQAARDAVRRAREYAEALGSTLTGLVALADVGLLETAPAAAPPPQRMYSAAPAAFRGGEPESVPELDFEPARQVVRAQVEARFTASPPDLSATT